MTTLYYISGVSNGVPMSELISEEDLSKKNIFLKHRYYYHYKSGDLFKISYNKNEDLTTNDYIKKWLGNFPFPDTIKPGDTFQFKINELTGGRVSVYIDGVKLKKLGETE